MPLTIARTLIVIIIRTQPRGRDPVRVAAVAAVSFAGKALLEALGDPAIPRKKIEVHCARLPVHTHHAPKRAKKKGVHPRTRPIDF